MIRQATPRNLLRFHRCAHHTHRGGFISIWIGGLVQGFFFFFFLSFQPNAFSEEQVRLVFPSEWKPVCRAHCVYCQKHFGVIGPIQCLWKCIEWNLDGIWSKQLHNFFPWLPSSECVFHTTDVVTEETHFFEKYLTLAVKNLVTLTAVWTWEKSTAFSFPPTRRFLHFFILVWTIQSKQMEIPFYSVIHFRSDVNWAISSDLFFTHKVNHDPSGSIHLPSSSISCSVFRLRRHPAS